MTHGADSTMAEWEERANAYLDEAEAQLAKVREALDRRETEQTNGDAEIERLRDEVERLRSLYVSTCESRDAWMQLAGQDEAEVEQLRAELDTARHTTTAYYVNNLREEARLNRAAAEKHYAESERLRAERDQAWDEGHIAGREKSPTMRENRELRERAEQAEARLADAHCLLQEAAAAVDPETWPELSEKLNAALEPCELSQCKHAQEAFAARDAAEARLAKVVEALRRLVDDCTSDPNHPYDVGPTVGSIDNARAALAAAQPEEK